MTGDDAPQLRKLRVLCFHGFRTSAAILEKQLSKWNSNVHELLDLTFLKAPYAARGKSDVELFFPPPYYEWFQYNHNFTEYEGLEHTIRYITDFMRQNGPFDGVLGFSQGAILSSALVGLQEKGRELLDIPRLKFIICISGAKLIAKRFEFVYRDPIRCPSIHLIGDKDWLRKPSEELLTCYKDPVLLRFNQGHTIPRLDDNMTRTMRSFLLQHAAAATVREKLPMLVNDAEEVPEVPSQEIYVHA